MENRIYSGQWMGLPKEVRTQLVKDFDIERTGAVEIFNEEVKSDGYTHADLSVFTVESMAAYVGSDASFGRLWELTVAKAKYELNPPTVEIGVGIIDSLIQVSPETLEVDVPTPYCTTCASKGGRHLKGCPLFK